MGGPCAQTPMAFEGEAPVEGAMGDVSDGELGKGVYVSRTKTQAVEPGKLGFAAQPWGRPLAVWWLRLYLPAQWRWVSSLVGGDLRSLMPHDSKTKA